MTELEERIMDTAAEIVENYGHLYDADSSDLFELQFGDALPEWMTEDVKIEVIKSILYLRKSAQSY